jgi:hypothetical protein
LYLHTQYLIAQTVCGNYYDTELLTSAFEADCIAAVNPWAAVGWTSISARVIFGDSFGLVGTLDKLLELKVSSPAASVNTHLTVITVAEPTAAFNLADISTVLDV